MRQLINNTINLRQSAQALTELWSPKVVAEFNDQYLKIAKVKGEFDWHKHASEDELFLILDGELTIQYEDNEVVLCKGDVHVVPKGVMHNPKCERECLLALIEPKSTKHTGDTVTSKTRSIANQLD